MSPSVLARRLLLNSAAGALLLTALGGRRRPRTRLAAGAGLLAFWSLGYRRYRRSGIDQTRREHELLRTASWEAYTRHYEERVPTIEEEFELWGVYHQHRHEMRYDLVADEVRRHARPGAVVVDVGSGSALVAERLTDLELRYVGLELGSHQLKYGRDKLAGVEHHLTAGFAQAVAERLPLADGSVDVVVMSEVIEHLMQPELAVWEVARVLRPGGVFVMTTNNASEVPLRSPLTHLFAWLEKALGATHPQLISLRPWIWPAPVDRELLPPGAPDVHVPHTHHIYGETSAMLAAAGLRTERWSTFEFPPPQAATSAWLEARGASGRRIVDRIEAVCRRLPLVRRMGCHLFVVAERTAAPATAAPPPGIWPGPLSAR